MFGWSPTKTTYVPVQFIFNNSTKNMWHVVRFNYRWFVNDLKHLKKLMDHIDDALECLYDGEDTDGVSVFDIIDATLEKDWKIKNLFVETLTDEEYQRMYRNPMKKAGPYIPIAQLPKP